MKTKSKFLRVLSLVSALAVLVACNTLFSPVSAEETSIVWDGTTATQPSGAGTDTDPYLISNGENLKWLLSQCTREYNIDTIISSTTTNKTYGKYYKLTNDIYLNDVSDAGWYEKDGLNSWNSGGYYTAGSVLQYPFLGTLDGDGHTINGIYYKGDNKYAGSLLPSIANGAVIKNLIIANSYIESTSTDGSTVVSALVANTHNGYSSSANANIKYSVPARIEKCYITDSVKLKATYCAGGLVGKAYNYLEIENCLSKADIATESKTQVNASNEQGYQRGAFVGNIGYASNQSILDINIKTSLAAQEPGLFPLTTFYSKVCNIDSVYMIENQEYWNNKEDGTPGNYTNVQYRELLVSVKEIKNVDLIKGDKAKDVLVGFNFDNTWQTVQDDTPTLLFPKAEINRHKNVKVQTGTETKYAKGTLCYGADFKALKAYLSANNITDDVEIGFVLSTAKALGTSELNLAAVESGTAVKASKTFGASELPDNLYCILKAPASHIDTATNTITGAYLTAIQYARAYVKYGDVTLYADTASAVANDLLNK